MLAEGGKIAGILGETVFRDSRLRGYILGLGVNLNMRSRDLSRVDQPAASLNRIMGTAVDRDAFLNLFLKKFFDGYDGFMKHGFASIRKKYLSRYPYIGRQLTVASLTPALTGEAEDIDLHGRLIIRTSEGAVAIDLGDVS